MSRLVTTDDLVPAAHLRALRRYRRAIQRLSGLSHSERMTADRIIPAAYDDLDLEIETVVELRSTLSSYPSFAHSGVLESLLRGVNAAEMVLDSLGSKGSPRFVRAFLNGLARDPSDPVRGVRTMAPLERPCHELRIMMVGDRYDTDMYPMLSIYGDKVLTVRLRRGKYQELQPVGELAAHGWPSPSHEVEDLHGVRELVVDHDVWESIPWVRNPPLVSADEEQVRRDLEYLFLLPRNSAAARMAGFLLGD